MSTTDLYAVGNAPVDILAKVQESFLEEHRFPKGECSYIEREFLHAVMNQLETPLYAPGGSAANTAACFGSLGGGAVFTGKVGNDKCGAIFLDSLTKERVEFISAGNDETEDTAQILTLTTDDAERTFAAYYGASLHISAKDIDEARLRKSRMTFLDAYMLKANAGAETLLTAARWAQSSGNRVAFTLADTSIIREHGEMITELLNHTQILFCNAHEAIQVTGESDENTAIKKLAERIEIGAVTRGDRGACVFSGKQVHCVPAPAPPKPVVDTNGAGDHYCAGFLYGISQGLPLEKCGQLASLCAAQAVTHAGARPVESLKSLLDQIEQ